jgi:hypothetical protein
MQESKNVIAEGINVFGSGLTTKPFPCDESGDIGRRSRLFLLCNRNPLQEILRPWPVLTDYMTHKLFAAVDFFSVRQARFL